MRYEHLIKNDINKVIEAYEENANTKSPKRAMHLHQMSWLSEMTMICGTIAYMLVGIFHFINPIYGYFWQHEFEPLMPLYIPFVDEKTAAGFAILMSIQTIEMFIGALSTGCIDFLSMTLILNVRIFSSVFKDDVNDLNDILHEENVDMTLAKIKLRIICEISYYDAWV